MTGQAALCTLPLPLGAPGLAFRPYSGKGRTAARSNVGNPNPQGAEVESANRKPVPRIVNVILGEISLRALRGESNSESSSIGTALALAIRYYLTEKDTYAPGWAYPRFRRELIEGEGVRVQITIDDAPWEALQREADRQGVSAERLAEHAALYFAAHLETGRIGRSVLDE